MSCEMTSRHTSLAAAIVAIQQHRWCRPSCRPPHRQGRPSRWTCDKSWDTRNTTPQRVPCLDSCHKARLGRTAPTTARRRWGRARERRTPGSHSPSPSRHPPSPQPHPAEGSSRWSPSARRPPPSPHHSLALPEGRQDCHSDTVLLDNVLLLRCVEMVGVGRISILIFFRMPMISWTAYLNFHHFDTQSWLLLPPFTRTCVNFTHFAIQSRNQDIWLPFLTFTGVNPAVYPRVFDNSHHVDIRSTAQKITFRQSAFEDITKTRQEEQ